MIETECALGSCKKPLKIAEEGKKEEGDEFWMIVFSYHTYFFCSHEFEKMCMFILGIINGEIFEG